MVDWLSEARIFTTLIIIIEEEQKNGKKILFRPSQP